MSVKTNIRKNDQGKWIVYEVKYNYALKVIPEEPLFGEVFEEYDFRNHAEMDMNFMNDYWEEQDNRKVKEKEDKVFIWQEMVRIMRERGIKV